MLRVGAVFSASAVMRVFVWCPVSSHREHLSYPLTFAGEDERGGSEHGASEKSK
jgi:hypothetical protein